MFIFKGLRKIAEKNIEIQHFIVHITYMQKALAGIEKPARAYGITDRRTYEFITVLYLSSFFLATNAMMPITAKTATTTNGKFNPSPLPYECNPER